MKRTRRTKRAITLIEMIVVMILIATITGAVALNYRESLNEGKAFRTKEGMDRLETVLALYYAEHPGIPIKDEYEERFRIVSESPLVRNPREFLKDGWGENYEVHIGMQDNSSDLSIEVKSRKYAQYLNEKNRKHS